MNNSYLEPIDKEKIIKYIVVFTVYKILIECVYVLFVSPTYSYIGFTFAPNILKCVISYVCFFVLLRFLSRELTINGILLNTFFAISTVPFLSFYWLADKNTLFVVYAVLFFVIFNAIAKLPCNPLFITLGNSFSSYETVISIIFLIYVITCIGLGVYAGGIDSRALSFSTIYSLRGEGRSPDGLFGYVLNWCAKSFFPMFVTYYLYKKKYIWAGICLLCQIFLYLCYGFKSYLLSAALTIAVYYISKNLVIKGKKSNIDNLYIFIVGLFPCFLSKFGGIMGTIGFEANSTYAMRMLFEPARIANGYFGYFLTNNKLYFSEGMIGKIFGLKYPFDKAIGFVITNYLMGSDAVSNSNTGIVADSYSQLGVLGIIVIAIFAGLIVLLIKRLCNYLPTYFVCAAFFYPVVMLNDNPLLTNILTNGWFLDIILIALFEGALRRQELSYKPFNDEGE